MSSDYRFLTEWRVPGTIAEVSDVLRDGRTLPDWWPSVYLAVRAFGEAGEVGGGNRPAHEGLAALHAAVDPDAHQPVTDTGFALSADGDLEGTGRWTFVQDGPEVVITYDWRVSADQAVAAPADLAVAAGVRGEPPLGDGARRGEPAAGASPAAGDHRRPAAAVPPPPGPTFPWLLPRSSLH